MALMPLARRLPYADADNVFLYGLSRGGMMSFLALKQGFPAKAIRASQTLPADHLCG
jgi:dipeptidyl aminopeptidase/acylaminoacyl peptidase